MCSHEGIHTFNDLIGSLFTPGVYMTCRKFLTIAGGTTRLQGIHHVVLSCIHMQRVGTFKSTGGGTCAAVVIDDERIFFIRPKVGGQIITPFNDVTKGTCEVPVPYLSKGKPVQSFRIRVGNEGRLHCFQIQQVAPVRVGDTHSGIGCPQGIFGNVE